MYNDKKYKAPRRNNKKRSFFSSPIDESSSGFMSDIEKIYSRLTNYEIYYSILIIILGISLYIYPSISITTMSLFIGISIILYSIIIFLNSKKRRQIPLFNNHIIYFIIGFLIGSATLLNIVIFKKIITFFMGIWFIYHAIIKIDLALKLRFMGENCWLFILISSILNIFMAIILIINPLHQLLINEIVGSFLILYAILNIANLFMLKNRAYEFLEQFE